MRAYPENQTRVLVKILFLLLVAIFPVEGRDALHAEENVREAWVRQVATSSLRSNDLPVAVRVDSAGNVIVLGYRLATASGQAAPVRGMSTFVLKYSPEGNLLWLREYDSERAPVALSMAPSGAVFVLSPNEMRKITPNGSYELVLALPVAAALIGVAGDGSFYIIGSEVDTVLSPDFMPTPLYNILLRAYDDGGRELWSRKYGRYPAVVPRSIALDDSGNVLMLLNGAPRRLFKYAASGDLFWSDSVSMQGSLDGLAVDRAGSAIICGGSGIVKYGRDGGLMWTTGGLASASLATDDTNNILASGRQSIDIVLRSIRADGLSIWERRIAGQGAAYDNPEGVRVAVSRDGDVTVLGSNSADTASGLGLVTARYSRMGDALWIRRFLAEGSQRTTAVDLAMHPHGRATILGSAIDSVSSSDAVILGYGSTGETDFEERFDGPRSSEDRLLALGLDPHGSPVVVESHPLVWLNPATTIPAQVVRWDIRKFDGKGEPIWTVPLDAASSKGFRARITTSGSTVALHQRVLTQYSSDGVVEWSRAPDISGGFYDFDVTDGSVVVVVGTEQITRYTHTYVRWLDPLGGTIRQFTTPYANNIYPEAMTVGRTGNAFVTAWIHLPASTTSEKVRFWCGSALVSLNTPAGDRNLPLDLWDTIGDDAHANAYFIRDKREFVRYDSAGGLSWGRTITLSGYPAFVRRALVRADGSIVATCATDSISPSSNILVSLDHAGQEMWRSSLDFEPVHLALDRAEEPYLIGARDSGFVVVAYDSKGIERWATPWVGESSPLLTASDARGNFYVAGKRGVDFLTSKFDPDGFCLWTMTRTGGGTPEFLVVNDSGGVFVGGATRVPDGTGYTLVKYSDEATTSAGSSPSQPLEFRLGQNFPNPFNPSTTIRYEVPSSSRVRLSVFDLLGREVAVLVNEKSEPGVHDVTFNASGMSSGMYFYRLQAGEIVQTRKLLILR